MKKFATIISLLLFFSPVFAQNFNVPEGYEFKTKEDYGEYQETVVDGISWILNTPLNSEPEKRKAINAFLLNWLSGSPNVTIELSEGIVTFMDCSDCLMAFLGGWTLYALDNPGSKDKLKGNMAGIETVIDFYKKNQDALGKNKAIEKYIKLQDKEKLEDQIKANIP